MQAAIIFPHQLFNNAALLDKNKMHYLVEEHLFFTQYLFHKEKLVLHRASMKSYEQYLLQEGYQVQYIDSTDALHDCRLLIAHLAKEKYTVIGMIDAFDAIEAAGDINPSLVASGIKVALLTTVFGLITAIILQIFYNLIVAMIDNIVIKMEDSSISFLDLLVEYDKKKK